jgi:protease IV
MTDQPMVAPTPEHDDLDRMTQEMAARWRWVGLALVILLGLLAGFGLSRAATPQPKIGIVRLYDTIDYSTSPYYFGPLQAAAERDDVAAVVILVDSGGGYATISEELYFTIRRLREQKPVVASIEGIGASGAYYAAVGSNFIYARPAATVGSIGVITGLPTQEPLDEETYATGPYKGGYSSTADFIREIELIKQGFLAHVYDERTYALEHNQPESRVDVLPDREMIATGQVWTGTHAYQIGLIDGLGSNQDAIEKAADLAGISHYKVIDLYLDFIEQGDEFNGYDLEHLPSPRTQATDPLMYFYYYTPPTR